MNKYIDYLKNKFILTSCLFVIYTLFLDDVDIFTIINQNGKLSQLEETNAEVAKKLARTKSIVKSLRYDSALETYAREKKLFKYDNEEIFVISEK